MSGFRRSSIGVANSSGRTSLVPKLQLDAVWKLQDDNSHLSNCVSRPEQGPNASPRSISLINSSTASTNSSGATAYHSPRLHSHSQSFATLRTPDWTESKRQDTAGASRRMAGLNPGSQLPPRSTRRSLEPPHKEAGSEQWYLAASNGQITTVTAPRALANSSLPGIEPGDAAQDIPVASGSLHAAQITDGRRAEQLHASIPNPMQPSGPSHSTVPVSTTRHLSNPELISQAAQGGTQATSQVPGPIFRGGETSREMYGDRSQHNNDQFKPYDVAPSGSRTVRGVAGEPEIRRTSLLEPMIAQAVTPAVGWDYSAPQHLAGSLAVSNADMEPPKPTPHATSHHVSGGLARFLHAPQEIETQHLLPAFRGHAQPVDAGRQIRHGTSEAGATPGYQGHTQVQAHDGVSAQHAAPKTSDGTRRSAIGDSFRGSPSNSSPASTPRGGVSPRRGSSYKQALERQLLYSQALLSETDSTPTPPVGSLREKYRLQRHLQG